jgi:hypothetical protein
VFRPGRRSGGRRAPVTGWTRGHRREVRLPQRAPARVVPEHLAEVARQLRGGLLEHRERVVDVAVSERAVPLRAREPCARVESAPRPLAASGLLRVGERLVERRPRAAFVSGKEGDGPLDEARERLMLEKPLVADLRAQIGELAREPVRLGHRDPAS